MESEPDEELRRQLLAKKLGQAGAAEAAELLALVQELVRQVLPSTRLRLRRSLVSS